jgi:hypothetical protein
MSIEIKWPSVRIVSNDLVEQMFVEAVIEGMIEPKDLSAKTAQHMAEALERAGIFYLARDKDQ